MLELVLLIVFIGSAIALAYVYVGYPALVYLIARLAGRPVRKSSLETTITIIITAFNEEATLPAKLENTLAIDYPADKLEIIVASDGSTDRTDAIAREYSDRGVKLVRREGRAGKTETQNLAVTEATGDIILFSDATTAYAPDILNEIAPNFADESVGCVAGKLVYVDPTASDVGKGAKNYWGYEVFLRQNESRACSLIGTSGCLYAVRRSAYVPMYSEACSDFLICTSVYRQGMRTVFEPAAVCFEETNRNSEKEFQMRVRISSQTFSDLWKNRDMLNPAKSGFFAVQLISHKLMRYCVPAFLLLIFVSSGLLAWNSRAFAALFVAQIAFYLLGFLTRVLEAKGMRLGLLAFPHYFLLANISSAVGFYKFLRGERFVRWEPIR